MRLESLVRQTGKDSMFFSLISFGEAVLIFTTAISLKVTING